MLPSLARMGKKEGFENISQGQVHSVGTKAMETLAANVHENAPEFDEAWVAALLNSPGLMNFCPA